MHTLIPEVVYQSSNAIWTDDFSSVCNFCRLYAGMLHRLATRGWDDTKTALLMTADRFGPSPLSGGGILIMKTVVHCSQRALQRGEKALLMCSINMPLKCIASDDFWWDVVKRKDTLDLFHLHLCGLQCAYYWITVFFQLLTHKIFT